MHDAAPLLIVDAANTVGAVPDGWWRDRRGATERLRDALVPLADAGLPGGRPDLPGWATGTPLEIVLVVEGAARGVRPVPGVRVEPAPGSGDDRIVELLDEQARRSPGRPLLLITSDRELRRRAAASGAVCAGPRAVRP